MALFARICVRVHSRIPAPTFPFPPYMWGEMEMGGCAIGRACMRMLVRMCMLERRERGRGTDGERGGFTCCKEYPQRPPPAAPGDCSPSFPGIFYLLQGISPGCSLVCVCARPITHPHFPPPIYRGENGHLGAYARACMRVRMRMREDGCLSCCGLYTPPQPQPQPLPAAPQCGKMQNLRFAGLFLCGGVIYQPSGENAGEGGKMGKFG